jgi:hypothetical protein
MPSRFLCWAFFLYIYMVTIGFFANNDLLAKIIGFFEGSPITHSAIGFEKDGKQYWLHAARYGAQIVDRGYLGGLCAEFPVLSNIQGEVELAEQKVGEPYSQLTLIGFAAIILAKHFGIAIDNPFYEKSAVVCSEFVIEVDSQHLIHEFDGLDPADITPALLFDICSRGDSFKRLL